MNNTELGKAFAKQSRARGRGSNFFFEGARAYSYGLHYTAAYHHGDCVLINSDGYSQTTQRHLLHIWRGAYAAGLVSWEVPNPLAQTAEEHGDNFEEMAERYRAEVARAKRARIHTSLEHAERLRHAANNYARRFGLPYRLTACGGES